jgi:RNA polymerase sigma factor (sigma-70 family)
LAVGNGVVSKGARLRRLVAADERLVARVRSGDPDAFETLYKRHSGELLSFCAYVLGSRHDAEDAVQTTFSAAYRALLAHERPIALRPWLFTIARNDCLSIMRKRRPEVELNGEPALRGDPYRELEVREEVRHTLKSLLGLPETQRAALVLAEMHGLSQAEIGSVLGVRADQVKAYVYQARSHLISDKRAREADCREIREELASARGAALLRGRLRRHVRACAGCRSYADGVERQRRQFSCLLPLTPSLLLKYRALEHAVASGRSAAPVVRAGGAAGGSLAAAAEVAGGVNGVAVKVAAGLACLGATACVGAGVLATAGESQSQSPASIVPGAGPTRSAGASASTASASATTARSETARRRREALRGRGGRALAGGEAEEPLPPLGAPGQQLTADAGADPAAASEPGTAEAVTGAVQPRPGHAERLLEREENQRASALQRANKSAERLRKTEAARSAAGASKRAQEEEAQERAGEREARQHEREARSASSTPKRTKEQRREAREAARRAHRH